MAIVTIVSPLNNGDAMPDPVTGTIGLVFADAHAEGAGLDGPPPPPDPIPVPVASVTVTFVRTDASAPDIDVPATVTGSSWAAASGGVPNGTYTVVATGSFGASDPPGSDARSTIHKP